MSSPLSLFVQPDGSASTILTFQLVLFFTFLAAIFKFCLAPGGLVWPFSKRKKWSIDSGTIWIPTYWTGVHFPRSLTHRKLAKLAHTSKVDQLMAFRVGFTRFIISSEPDTAKEILNSSAFADRPIKVSAYELLFDRAMGFAPFGEYWRDLRRISATATHMFSPKKLAGF